MRKSVPKKHMHNLYKFNIIQQKYFTKNTKDYLGEYIMNTLSSILKISKVYDIASHRSMYYFIIQERENG
jgi:hypothetical protein